MPRVHHVHKAQKDYPQDGIKKGESYYWWKFRYAEKCRSKTHPTPSQLTRSEFWGEVFGIQEELSACSDRDELSGIIERIRELATQQEEKKNNMPDSLQDGPIGELLDERQTSLDEWADELEGVDEDEDLSEQLSTIQYNGQ